MYQMLAYVNVEQKVIQNPRLDFTTDLPSKGGRCIKEKTCPPATAPANRTKSENRFPPGRDCSPETEYRTIQTEAHITQN